MWSRAGCVEQSLRAGYNEIARFDRSSTRVEIGLKNYASLTITEILGRFKEKKATVVAAARMEAACRVRRVLRVLSAPEQD